MRFVLIAPTASPVPLPDSARPSEVHDGRFEGIRMRQLWSYLSPSAEFSARELSAPVPSPADAPDAIFRVVRAAMCWVRERSIVVLEVDVDGVSPSDLVGPAVGDVEVTLNTAADQFIAQNARLPRLSWVGRLAIVDEGYAVSTEWVGQHRPAHTVVIGEDARLSVGWGNSAVTGVAGLPALAWRELVRGLVDAQVLWGEVSEIAASAAQATDTVFGERSSRRALAAYQRRLRDLNLDLAMHHLGVDDLLMGMQGTRRIAAEAALKAWGYDEFSARVTRRLEDLGGVARAEEATRSGRYQVLVESTLFILAAVTVLDLALAIIGAAYAGGVSGVPGAGSPLGILSTLRAVDADIIVAVGLLVLLGLFGMLLFRRGRS